MTNEREILAERITNRLKELDLTARNVSIQATGKPDVIRDLQRRKSTPNGPTLARIADALQTTSDWLLGNVENPGQLRSEVSFHELPQGWREPGAGSIPLLGTAFCADLIIEQEGESVAIEQIQLEVDHTVRMIERPSALWNAPNAYAIYFQGSSMERRFYQGEIGIVDPRRPPSPGHIVLVKLNDGESQTVMTALVKELVRATSAYVELLQYNPEISFRIPRNRVEAMERIYRPDELLHL
ncbi:MAG: S24 family peptidase [Novosphingobium sp.]